CNLVTLGHLLREGTCQRQARQRRQLRRQIGLKLARHAPVVTLLGPICGAQKAIAMPKIAARHHPQDTRFAMAIAPSTITRITAVGGSRAMIWACSAVAPVMKGEPCCAAARTGTASSATATELS